MASQANEPALELRYAGQLVEQLGAQLYPKVTASVAELISNAWDADADHVWVTMPFDHKWDQTTVIEVVDDGHGMTREQAQDRYLVVGRNRRREEGAVTSEEGRPLHGRKGIGKLAAFGTAGYLELVTCRDGEITAFGIDYERLRRLRPTERYEVEPVDDADQLVDPLTGTALEHGTRVRLTQLKAKRRSPSKEFRDSMARRFALDNAEMTVFINGDPLKRFEYDVVTRYPRDARPPSAIELEVTSDDWGIERLDVTPFVDARRERVRRQLADALTVSERAPADGSDAADDGPAGSGGVARPVEPDTTDLEPTLDQLGIPTLREDNTVEIRWWVGFSGKPIAEQDVRGVSILARHKLAQRPFMFELTQGTEGQIMQEYLVGEVVADWLDIGSDADDDFIQSNRDQLQFDDTELEPLLTWGQERLRWAMASASRTRSANRANPGALSTDVERVIQRAPARTRVRLRTLASRIADFTPNTTALAKAVDVIVSASDLAEVEKARQVLRLDGDPDAEATWALLNQAADAAADLTAALLETRADALNGFGIALQEPPVEALHRQAVLDPWIVSPVLALGPREIVRQDDDIAIARISGLEPLVSPWTLICFPVGLADPPTLDHLNGNSLVVGGPSSGVGVLNLSWQEAVQGSELTHRLMLDAVRGR